MIPPWAPTLPPTLYPGQGGKAHANLEMDRAACLEARRDGDAGDGLAQLYPERALELPTAGTKPKDFGACPEKRLCARQLVLGTATTGIAL
jgi:hypothetical protein